MVFAIPRSPLPAIHISLAPYEAPAEEPKSPFNCLSPISPADDDGPRSALLTPPPCLSPGRASPLSPLRPADSPVKGTGLERERFEALLKASRERNGMISGGTRKTHDLRKEIALKAHKSKQSERRALFLSKLQAPPSPTATMTAKTPPESPAILHYTLPSPGLASPLALFDSMSEADQQAFKSHGWVEQVDFRLPEGERVKPVVKVVSGRGKPLPSLAQISARLSAQGNLPQFVSATPPAASEKVEAAAPKRRLPAFLQKKDVPQVSQPEIVQPDAMPVVKVDTPVVQTKSRVLLTVGRLRAPAHAKPAAEEVVSPGAPPVPKLHVTTTVVPRTSHTSPTELTESKLNEFNSRARTVKDMLSTLRRRTSAEDVMASPAMDGAPVRPKLNIGGSDNDVEKNTRRRSSPAELPHRRRTGFAHPVLALPGAF